MMADPNKFHKDLLVISAYFPPFEYGSGLVMKNLLNRIDSRNIAIVTKKRDLLQPDNYIRYSIFSDISISFRLNIIWHLIQIPFAVIKLLFLIRKISPKVILCVYPDYFYLKASIVSAKLLHIPQISYLHDTLSENQKGTIIYSRIKALQEELFREPQKIMVISGGLKELYESKYGKEITTLRHTFIDFEKKEQLHFSKECFFSGSVYGINRESLARLVSSAKNQGFKFTISTSSPTLELSNYKIIETPDQVKYFNNWKDYYDNLLKQSVLLVSLDWPDESNVDVDELSTIFPTKIPEYLSTGNPIIVHCPKNYYLAKFFVKYQCGIVISERDENSIIQSFMKIEDDETRGLLRENSIKTMDLFREDVNFEILKKKILELSPTTRI